MQVPTKCDNFQIQTAVLFDCNLGETLSDIFTQILTVFLRREEKNAEKVGRSGTNLGSTVLNQTFG